MIKPGSIRAFSKLLGVTVTTTSGEVLVRFRTFRVATSNESRAKFVLHDEDDNKAGSDGCRATTGGVDES